MLTRNRQAAHGGVTVPPRFVLSTVTLLISLLALASLCADATAQPRARARAAREAAPPPERLGVVSDETLLRIMRAEDERRWDVTDLGALINDRVPAVRRRAALAAGRIGDAGAVAPLALLLQRDTSESVRAMAAFALGETELGDATEALLGALRASRSGEVRARAVEALGKIAAALSEKDAARKAEIGRAILLALAAEQNSPRPDRGVVMMALTAALRARPQDASKTVALYLVSPDARVRADAANTLARLRAKDVNESLRPLLTNDVDPVVRANVARALGAAEDQASFDALTARTTNDLDERVRVSAVRALASLKDARAAAPMMQRGELLLAAYRASKTKGAAHPSETNEILEVATALSRVLAGTNSERAVQWLRAFREASSGQSAPEIEIAFARIAPTLYVRERAAGNAAPRAVAGGAPAAAVWQSVSSIAQGLGEIAAMTSAAGGNSAVSLQADAQLVVRSMLSDPATPALAMPDVMRAVAAFKPMDQGEVMRAKLSASDVLVRATAAELLGALDPDPQNTRALAAALPKALEDQLNDAALSILDALARQKSPEADEAIKSVLGVPDYLVRRRAATLLRQSASAGASSPAAASSTETVATRNKLADYRRAIERTGRRVEAIVSTDKGDFTIEFVPGEAPLTVDNFVELARRKYFDGVSFHRVVPNFVVQGGDPRGDGNGGPGYQIRCEINMVPYARGAVGMALSGKDTGGSQWFVTHSPQPHLDGGYTVFGRVTEGMEVVDRITRGDLIRNIRIVESAAKAPPRARVRGR